MLTMGFYNVKHVGCKQRNNLGVSRRWILYRKKYAVKGRAIHIEHFFWAVINNFNCRLSRLVQWI